MPTSFDRPTVAGLQMLARAVSGHLVGVKVTSEQDQDAYMSGNTIAVDGGRLNAVTRAQVVVQAAMYQAGSFDPRVMRHLVGRSGATARYCAMEGLRALALTSDRLPPFITALAAGLTDIPMTSSAEESMRIALARPQVPPAPEFFGRVKPGRALLGASARTGSEHDGDVKIRNDSNADEADDPDTDSDEAKSLDLLSNPLTANHPMGRLIQSLFKHSGGKSADATSQAGGGKPVAKPSKRPSGGRRFDIGRRIASAAQNFISGSYLGDARYPEWDESSKRYRKDWVTVHELEPWNPDGFRDHAALARIDVIRAPTALTRSLARHVLEIAPYGRSEFGEQLHTDGVVDLAYWRRSGSGSPPLPFIGKKRQRPAIAALVLLDVSSSTLDTTAGVDGDTGSVFDQHLKLSYRITTALDALGVPVGLYAFRSWGRDMVHVMPIKGLRESPSALTIERIGHLSPAGFTRIGGAVRHCTTILERQTEGMKRVVILVSDGHPYDDGYEGAQASGDTRHAMSEARLRGVGFVCVGVTAPNSNDSHNPGAALDSASVLHVANISGIERQLGKLIRQALADTRRRGDHTSSALPA